jgi:2-phospho-L-lactate guanylyltransferase
MGSQMHLSDQARYEFEALRLLEPAGRTPKPLYIDDAFEAFPYGFLVMEFLPGRALQYERDLPEAARCLADIHNLEIPAENHLIMPENPLAAILDECHAMFRHFMDCDFAAPDIKSLISSLLKHGDRIAAGTRDMGIRCLINTELNSGNFLVNDNDRTYLVDWEKPLYACPGQDLGHFLAPTTTFWKTDKILGDSEIQEFLQVYCDNSSRYKDVDALREDTLPFIRMNCLRGITWCAMAWVEYQSPDRVLKDDFTFAKIKNYIAPEFLERIAADYLGRGRGS